MVIQSFLTFDSMDRTLKLYFSSCCAVLYCGAVFFKIFTQFVILENISILDLAPSGVKGLKLL